jgi:hypothetical protein
LNSDDPWVQRLAQLDADCRRQGMILIPSCWYERRYSPSELAAAGLLQLKATRWFEPCGEECGTIYDESTACPVCQAGATLRSPLRLRASAIPKGADVAMSIAEELVFSERFAEILRSCGLPDAALEAVETGTKRADARTWYRPTDAVPTLDVSPLIRAGNNPINGLDPPFGRCERGDTLGLNLLSELFVVRREGDSQPLYRTAQFFGHRMGLLRPAPKWIIAQRVWKEAQAAKMKGLKLEVVHEV